eukprot:6492624-Amphidinium_carterae.4
MDGVYKRKQEHDCLQELRTYVQERGLQAAIALKEALPSLPFTPEDLIPIPSSAGPTFHWPCKPLQGPTRAAGFASHSGATNLSTHLENDWLKSHEPIMARDCEVPVYAPPMSKCCVAGFCVHRGDGKKVWSLSQSLTSHMRSIFNSPDMKTKLSSGMVVGQFTRAFACSSHGDDDVDIYMHLGHMCFSPYRPTMHIMQKVMEHPLLADEVPGLIVLKVICAITLQSPTRPRQSLERHGK